MRYLIRYEDENVRCVAQNIRCCIRFVIYDIVCEQCDIVCYIRHPMSNIRYRKLQHRMSKHTISYDPRIRCRNTISYVLTYDIVTYDIVYVKDIFLMIGNYLYPSKINSILEQQILLYPNKQFSKYRNPN